MTTINLREVSMHTFGELPQLHTPAPEFVLTKADLSMVSLADFKGRALLLNVYPSIDTSVCFESVKKFHQALGNQQNIAIACISMDLPFALSRIQQGESLQDINLLSDFRTREFGDAYGVTIADGPLAGLLARAVFILDSQHNLIYQELVSDVSQPPNYEAALKAIINE